MCVHTPTSLLALKVACRSDPNLQLSTIPHTGLGTLLVWSFGIVPVVWSYTVAVAAALFWTFGRGSMLKVCFGSAIIRAVHLPND